MDNGRAQVPEAGRRFVARHLLGQARQDPQIQPVQAQGQPAQAQVQPGQPVPQVPVMPQLPPDPLPRAPLTPPEAQAAHAQLARLLAHLRQDEVDRLADLPGCGALKATAIGAARLLRVQPVTRESLDAANQQITTLTNDIAAAAVVCARQLAATLQDLQPAAQAGGPALLALHDEAAAALRRQRTPDVLERAARLVGQLQARLALQAQAGQDREAFRRRYGDDALDAMASDYDAGKDFKKVLAAAKLLSASADDGVDAAAQALITTVDDYLSDGDRQQHYASAVRHGSQASTDEKNRIRRADQARRLRADAMKLLDHQNAALVLHRHHGSSPAEGGSSEVDLIRDAKGRIAYAFKAMDRETPQTGLPEGGGAVREVMAGAMTQAIYQQIGVDFGFPQAVVADMGNGAGALIEGLPGACMDTEAQDKKKAAREAAVTALESRARRSRRAADNAPQDQQLQQAAANDEATAAQARRDKNAAEAGFEQKDAADRAKWKKRIDAIPPQEIQKAVFANIVMGNFDTKWGNCIAGDDGTIRPFDSGAAFPTDFDMATNINGDKGTAGGLLSYPGARPEDPQIPAASMPLDAELVRSVQSINVRDLRASMREARDRILGAGGLRGSLLEDSCIDRTIQGIVNMQNLLRQNPGITLAEFTRRYDATLATLCTQEQLAAQTLSADAALLENASRHRNRQPALDMRDKAKMFRAQQEL